MDKHLSTQTTKVEASEKSANFCPHEGLLQTTTLRVCNKRINISGRHTLRYYSTPTPRTIPGSRRRDCTQRACTQLICQHTRKTATLDKPATQQPVQRHQLLSKSNFGSTLPGTHISKTHTICCDCLQPLTLRLTATKDTAMRGRVSCAGSGPWLLLRLPDSTAAKVSRRAWTSTYRKAQQQQGGSRRLYMDWMYVPDIDHMLHQPQDMMGHTAGVQTVECNAPVLWVCWPQNRKKSQHGLVSLTCKYGCCFLLGQQTPALTQCFITKLFQPQIHKAIQRHIKTPDMMIRSHHSHQTLGFNTPLEHQ
jgi:hypothetical protein